MTLSQETTLFISAYRDFSVRYLLYSDIFAVLRESGVRIVLFLRDEDLPFYREKFLGSGVIMEPIQYELALAKLRKNRVASFFMLVRKCMSGSEAGFQNTTDDVRLYQYEKEYDKKFSTRIRFRAACALVSICRRYRWMRNSLVRLESALFSGKMYDAFFIKYRPSMAIVSSLGHMIDPLFMRSASRHGCMVVSAMRNFDAPTTKEYRGAHIDHVLVWNEVMQHEIRAFHDIPDECIHRTGIAHWDFYFNGRFKPRPRGIFLKENGLRPDRKIVFYATSGFRLFQRSFDVIEQLLEAMENGQVESDAQLLVRLHPAYLSMNGKGGTERFIEQYAVRMEALKHRFGDRVSFVPPRMTFLEAGFDTSMEDMLLLAETFHYSDVLLNEYSTVMIEATIFDLPVINVGLHHYRDTDKPMKYIENFTHIQRLIHTGAARNVYAMAELIAEINRYLSDPSADRDGRKRLFAQEISTNIGRSGRATGERILSLLSL